MHSRIWTVFQYFWVMSFNIWLGSALACHTTSNPRKHVFRFLDIFTSQQQCKYMLANENRSPDLQKLRARGECFHTVPSLHKCVKHLVVVLMEINMPWCASLCRTANVVCPPAIWYIVDYSCLFQPPATWYGGRVFLLLPGLTKIRSWLNKLQANPLLSEIHTQSWRKQGELRSSSWTWSIMLWCHASTCLVFVAWACPILLSALDCSPTCAGVCRAAAKWSFCFALFRETHLAEFGWACRRHLFPQVGHFFPLIFHSARQLSDSFCLTTNATGTAWS